MKGIKHKSFHTYNVHEEARSMRVLIVRENKVQRMNKRVNTNHHYV